MKAKDLPFFHTWEEREPRLHDGVFCVPRYYEAHERKKLPPLESELIFGNERGVYIEYCSGNGEWVLERALKNPHQNWIAVEVQFDRVRKIWAKKKNLGLTNLLIVYGKAEDFTKHYLDTSTVQGIAINFPDPWPKSKHAKNRLIQSPFIEEIARVSKEGAALFVVTDDVPYRDQVLFEMDKCPLWKRAFNEPCYHIEGYGLSFFHRLWEGLGKKIHYMKFIRGEPS